MGPRSRSDTRKRLLDSAEQMINEHGFAATSIDKLIEAVGVTKGSFFYHFKSKADLAQALIDRFAEGDRQLLESNLERAEKLSDDPLQQILIFIGLLLEVVEQMDLDPNPGCLFATYCYEGGLFGAEAHATIASALEAWTNAVASKLDEAKRVHPPQVDFESRAVADMISVVFEGTYVMARVFPGRQMFSRQLRNYRNYIQLLFGKGVPTVSE